MSSGLEQVINNDVKQLKESQIYDSIIISIVIPTYKRGKLIIDSLNSIINQVKNNNVEVIVLSNDPDDELSFLVEKYKDNKKLSILRNHNNLGMCGNINKCIDVAHGKYIAYLHDDDMVTPDYLDTILKYIKRFPEVDCFIPMRYVLNSNTSWGGIRQKKNQIKHIISCALSPLRIGKKDYYQFRLIDIYRSGRNCFSAPTCGTVYKKSSLVELGGFNPEWKYAFDFVFYERFIRKHRAILIRKPLGIYRMEESASNKGNVQLEFFKAHKYALDRNKNISLVRNYYYEYLHLFYMGLSNEARKLINSEFGAIMNKWNPFKYGLLRLRTEWFYFTSGIETGKYLSNKRKKELGL